jgi:hypothetical protein
VLCSREGEGEGSEQSQQDRDALMKIGQSRDLVVVTG